MCNCGGAIRYNRAAVEAAKRAAKENSQSSTPAVETPPVQAVAPVRRSGRGGYRLPRKLV